MRFNNSGSLQQVVETRDKTLQSTESLMATREASNSIQPNHTINNKIIDKHRKHVIKHAQLRSTS